MKTPATSVVPCQDVSTGQMTWLLVGDIADILDDGLDSENLRWLLPVLESLVNVMRNDEQRDAGDEYLREVLDVSPNLFDQVDALHRFRSELLRELVSLVDWVRQAPPLQSSSESLQPALSRTLNARMLSWVDRMTTHYRDERELCQAVWYMELGDGD